MNEINDKFKSLCNILFSKPIGNMDEFQDYFTQYIEQPKVRKTQSGKNTYYVAPYCDKARFSTFDESLQPENAKPIDINDIKDIDSIVRAVGESQQYTGNKVLGNSKFVKESENIIDSSVIYRSSEIVGCEYIAYSDLLRNSRYMFACVSGGDSSYCLRCMSMNQSQRCFESTVIFYCSDTFYSNNCKSCHNMLFSFDQQAKKNMIGNNALSQEKYSEIRNRLIQQMADNLKTKKRLPSLLDFFEEGEDD